MKRFAAKAMLALLALPAAVMVAEADEDFVPVTDAMLRNPDPADWLMHSRTYDEQRYSPLDQINRDNVSELERVWSTPLPSGVVEFIPIVHDGIMYFPVPAGTGEGGGVMALDARTGKEIWHYRPEGERALTSRAKTISIYEDMILFSAPASGREAQPVIALDARTGELRWSTPVTQENHTSGTLVVNGKVISGRTCNSARENCYIAAHDARTGKEVWRFYTTAGAGEPGDASWAGVPENERRASTWGLPGSFDPELGLLYWGISNPMPNTRADRHGGNPSAIPAEAPADLYSDSTVALNPDTGELVWYYQHLPGDDWDMDINHEKVLVSTALDPDPAVVKWINPNIRRGEVRDIVMTSGEGGGVWINDRRTGEFLWAIPFPYDTPNFILSDIDVNTGKAKINWDVVLTEPGANRTICFWNTRNFWPSAYSPEENSIFIPYFDYCLSMTRATADGGREMRTGARRPGSDPEKFAGIAKIDLRTGHLMRFNEGRVGGDSAMLTTGGGLLFWGDLMQVFHAFDVRTGKELWKSEPTGSTIMMGTITYAVDGRQYVAIVNGNSAMGGRTMAQWGGFEMPEDRGNAITVFALPE
jgi:alcohol dehydrogenase (cytochrome c)